ncbi:Phosphoenolpyruvate synthase [Candidatus Methanoperedenaceae archaeon GB50]|nr:Phosphoenolpyruvate synthase [Candidatus Methanoperedenaceae archaeon GB50]CAD7779791.1 MAG: Phosphoenolpyruvate synthase [Candidatus Methanoperedenaceae archaeon GB50]
MSSEKFVYFFGGGSAEGNASMKELLGGKGANIAEMAGMGIPVPPGFTITTRVCKEYYANGKKYPPGLKEEVEENLSKLEEMLGKRFGGGDNPLLLSIRSGAPASMPGMMDTVLNLGLNDETVLALQRKTGNGQFAYDSYRRFITMFGEVVLGIDHEKFERILAAKKDALGVKLDNELDTRALKELVDEFKKLVRSESGVDFPQDPRKQLWMAINAVFDSWNNKRAVTYRRLNKIPEDWCTAVNVQSMVFGNMGENSGTGVAFTRNPATGEKRFFGEFLMNAQGEDVVAGIRTPQPIEDLKNAMPEVYDELESIYKRLETHFKDMQDIEFTIEDGKLFMLQTRTGKRTATAAIKIAVDMVKEGLITETEAVKRIKPEQVDQILHPMIDPDAKVEVIARGLPASPGAAVGKIVFTADRAEELAANGEKVILVRTETSPDDIGGMNAAEGILTARGGMTSHAAVVARGMGKCCVAGCGEITIDEAEKKMTIGDLLFHEGDYITLDGSKGEVMKGSVKLIDSGVGGEVGELLRWADDIRRLGVRTNADTPHDAGIARDFGAEGIGLCRTEHMFFGEERIPIVQEMILAESEEERMIPLAKLLEFQREDFKGIFKEMRGLPVTIRLLDPPLHEFLPKKEELVEKINALRSNVKLLRDEESELEKLEEMMARVEKLHEFNPMLGHRGCRLGITYPEIYNMQVQAIIEAAAELMREGETITPEIMIPLVGELNELKVTKRNVIETAEKVMREKGVKLNYLIGTMIELPRAAITADEIAEEAEFFSFGTNDLTQTTFGFSRDDAGKFLQEYIEKGILPHDPFVTLDKRGVGELMKIAIEKGKKTNPDIKLGICGEHGGDPESIKFADEIGLDYVSCSPYRIPVARIAAAHATLAQRESEDRGL